MAHNDLFLEETQVDLDLGNIPPETFLIIVSDHAGNKKILSLAAGQHHQSQLVLHDVATGLCFRPIGGVWQWIYD